jgi:hypothetical protein
MDFIKKHCNEMIALEPRTECLETPINVTKEPVSNHWGNYTNTKIEVDNTRTNGVG